MFPDAPPLISMPSLPLDWIRLRTIVTFAAAVTKTPCCALPRIAVRSTTTVPAPSIRKPLPPMATIWQLSTLSRAPWTKRMPWMPPWPLIVRPVRATLIPAPLTVIPLPESTEMPA